MPPRPQNIDLNNLSEITAADLAAAQIDLPVVLPKSTRPEKIQIQGRVPKAAAPQTLDEAMYPWKKKKKDISEADYEKQLRRLGRTELDTEAISKYGLIPKENREQMITSILREFKKKKVLSNVTKPSDSNPKLNREQKEAVERLIGGRR